MLLSDYDHLQLKLVTLTDPSDPQVCASVDLHEGDFNQVARIGVSGNRVFCTLGRPATPTIPDLLNLQNNVEPKAVYYLKLIDCDDPSNPNIGELINIPGIMVALRNGMGFTVDPQWDQGNLSSRFCAVQLDEGQAELIDTVELGSALPESVHISGNLAAIVLGPAWGTGYDGVVALKSDDQCQMGSFNLIGIDLSDPENLTRTIDENYSGNCQIKSFTDGLLIGQIGSTLQGLFWIEQIDGAFKLKVLDMPGTIEDTNIMKGQIDMACGPAGVVTVNIER